MYLSIKRSGTLPEQLGINEQTGNQEKWKRKPFLCRMNKTMDQKLHEAKGTE